MAAPATDPTAGIAARRSRVVIGLALRSLAGARTWLAAIHLLLGLLTGLLAFVVVVTGLALGLGMTPLALIGFPLLAAVYWFCGWFARAERARFGLLLGTVIPAPERLPAAAGWRRIWRGVTSPAFRRQLGYALLRLPLSVLQAAVLTIPWSAGLALLTLPGYNWALPHGGAHWGGAVLRGPAALTGAAVLGAALLLAAPWVTRALAAGDASVAGWLLGSRGRAELTARIGELEISRARAVDSAEAERRRIERDLHDGAQQRLVALAMELGRAKARLATDPQAAEAIIGQAHEQAKAALTELRNLVRGMHPPVLSDRGLDAALSGLATLSPVPVTVRVELDARPPVQVEAIAYFVVAEALTNVAKHARAGHADVHVDRDGSLLRVRVADDGVGGADPRGQGLAGLADRVAAVDGRLAVSSPAGGPTTIEVLLPCGS